MITSIDQRFPTVLVTTSASAKFHTVDRRLAEVCKPEAAVNGHLRANLHSSSIGE